MARRKDSPQKAAMREMMRDYLKNNDISSKRQILRLPLNLTPLL